MNLHTWLDRPENRGQAKALAAHLGVSGTAVSFWRDNGVPLGHMTEVVKFSKGAVKVQSMVDHAIAARAKTKQKAEVSDLPPPALITGKAEAEA